MKTIGTYEPPCTEEGSLLIPGQEGELAPGVRGYAIAGENRILIPLIIAEEEGSGAVGQFLDSLSRRCVIPNVTSRRLAQMLIRRGWLPVFEDDCDVWQREAAK